MISNLEQFESLVESEEYSFDHGAFVREVKSTWHKVNNLNQITDLTGKPYLKFISLNLSRLCGYNFRGETVGEGRWVSIYRLCGNQIDNRNIDKSLWCNVCRILFIITTISLTFNCIIQLKYDLSLLQLKKYQASHGGNCSQLEDGNLTNLTERVRYYENYLDAIGGTFRELHFVIEPNCFFILWIAIVCYLQSQIYNFLVEPFEPSIIKCLLNQEYFLDYYSRMLIGELNSYRLSGKSFVANFAMTSIDGQVGDTSRQVYWSEAEKQLAIQQYLGNLKLLKTMTLNGTLIPLNKSSAWLEALKSLFDKFAQILLFSIMIFSNIYMFLTFALADRIHLKMADLIFLLQFYFAAGISMMSSLFYLACVAINTIDYVKYAAMLSAMIRQSIDLSNYNMAKLLEGAERNGKISRISQKDQENLNGELLFILIHLKLFKRQHNTQRSTITYFLLCAMEIASMVLLTSMLALPYVRRELFVFVTFPYFFFSILSDICLFSICYFHCKCVDLFKLVFDLAANLSKHTSTAAATKFGQAYDKHVIRLIHKELHESSQSINQFAISMFGIAITYENVLKYHFYIGLFIVYIFCSVNYSKLAGSQASRMNHGQEESALSLTKIII